MVMEVREIMLKPLIIEFDKDVKTAGEIMRKNRRYSIIVCKNKKPIGILTDSDIIKKIVADDKQPSKIKVEEVMSAPIVTISPNEEVIDAAKKMKKNKIKRLPVIDNNTIVGMIELSDVARASPEMMELLEYKIKMRDMNTKIVEDTTSGICDFCGDYFERLKNVQGQWLCEGCKDESESE